MYRQRKYAVGPMFTYWKVARVISERSQRRLQMKWNRIVDTALDLVLQQSLANGVPPRRSDHEQMVSGFDVRLMIGHQQFTIGQQVPISLGDLPAARIPRVQPLQLGAQHRSLDRVEARVVAAILMGEVRHAAVIAKTK